MVPSSRGFESPPPTFWGHFGVNLGSLWGHLGVSLGHFGITLGSVWGQFGVTLESLWGHCGVSLGSVWGHVSDGWAQTNSSRSKASGPQLISRPHMMTCTCNSMCQCLSSASCWGWPVIPTPSRLLIPTPSFFSWGWPVIPTLIPTPKNRTIYAYSALYDY